MYVTMLIGLLITAVIIEFILPLCLEIKSDKEKNKNDK